MTPLRKLCDLPGVVLRDIPRYRRALSYSGADRRSDPQGWISLCNRIEAVNPALDGPGVVCQWTWGSPLHAAQVLPSLSRRLLGAALTEWPIRFVSQPQVISDAPKLSFVFAHAGTDRLPQLQRTLRSIFAQRDVPCECIVIEHTQPSLLGDLPMPVVYRHLAKIQQELGRIQANVAVDPEFAFVDPVFIDTAVDFLRTYADRCHHGKEEDILFAELDKKELSPEDRRVMAELVREHVKAREATAPLVKVKEDHLRQDPEALDRILGNLARLVELYPGHIEKEDKLFFVPIMEYFAPAEKEGMLARMEEFDRQMIHEKYRTIIEAIEGRRTCGI